MTDPNRPAAIALWITASLIAFFAVGLIARPGDLRDAHGADAMPTGGYATEFRASSGGFKLGAAIAMGWMTTRRRYREGLILAVAILAGSTTARTIGCLSGDATPLHWIVIVAEAIGVVSCGWHLWRLGDDPAAPTGHAAAPGTANPPS